MAWFCYLPLLIAAAYTVWQIGNFQRWATGLSISPDAFARCPSIAVLVPFRNEKDHLPALVESLYAQQYPGYFEILLIDDHSTDGGAATVAPPGVQLRTLRLADYPEYINRAAYKKSALTLGIDQVDCEVIVTTDADCQWSPMGLTYLGEAFARGADVVLGPVLVDPVTDYSSAFQALDVLGYQLLTGAMVQAGVPGLANGANFAFRKRAFTSVSGYRGVDHLPSGDDVLLLHKFVAAKNLSIRYVGRKEAAVTTLPVEGWRSVWYQRLRWAGKAGNYASPALTFAQGLAFVTSASIVGCLLLGLVDWRFAGVGLGAWTLKSVVDGVLLGAICRHYGQAALMRWYGFVQLIHPFYLVAVGTAALLGVKVSWKGRR
ncbi:cellulose synthase/poly-beta-1,6-N-acetylglucosamine synthase-like glycosyltransferase [Neolewinella xylanilytica]|uniref:Cellulose synthase/poly-beta-1,6-N-acetylglucosamine synthase-like glycosyltransferase n=1 Tax=Neolewinella xylanilytica TaxID=1514080 RepID=A0A2S6I9T9_9BACT|nr:glycosyltransferase [Neolewinella xylanilytica]PPK88242.1 cellulose synthase/poly-beta-1,6-N-acetylglucosamine synthase-like glycosyltransferase [Neolewinella xylanilytica]